MILSELAIIDAKKIEAFFEKFINCTYEGYINSICQPSSNLSMEENIESVSAAIMNALAQQVQI
jgi:hypothetical protein